LPKLGNSLRFRRNFFLLRLEPSIKRRLIDEGLPALLWRLGRLSAALSRLLALTAAIVPRDDALQLLGLIWI
jgi:hypothetical protein